MNRAIRPCPQTFDERVASLRRPHRDDDDLTPVQVAKPYRLRKTPPVERANDVWDALPDYGLSHGIESHLGDLGHLLYADDESHIGIDYLDLLFFGDGDCGMSPA